MPADYLSRTGYRLPTEAEWEYACRAGTSTMYGFGDSPEWLDKHAWMLGNARDRSWQVGRLKPNNLGLFDMHGNAFEWTQDPALYYRMGSGLRPLDDNVFLYTIDPNERRLLRGGSWNEAPRYGRAAYRFLGVPGLRFGSSGFRVVVSRLAASTPTPAGTTRERAGTRRSTERPARSPASPDRGPASGLLCGAPAKVRCARRVW